MEKNVLDSDSFLPLLQRLQTRMLVRQYSEIICEESGAPCRQQFLIPCSGTVCWGWVVLGKLIRDHITLSWLVNWIALEAALENGHSFPGPEHDGLAAGCMF